ncbi:hypothetical protein [Halobacterium bonnevillei]|uniref:Uncharacterized protein n=1 Tax=Halobacterium bonnevillei TaxID=2692200 RepID=A0A6B0SG99_9EURY|nr:hypothetical protein [Halobacterium bonnevillei]MXR20027.1 hypothetical protein [Halobacterium bonnevillei]
MPEGGDENADLVKTAIRLIRSEEVVALKDRVFRVVERGISAVFSLTTSDDDGTRTTYNQDILELPDQEVKIVEKGEGVEPLQQVEEEGETVVELNLDAFTEEGKREILDEVVPTEQSQGRLLKHEQEREFEVADEARRDDRTKEIIEFFSEYLSKPQLKLLRRSQSIRIAWERDDRYTPPETMREWKSELEDQFGETANLVTNFCSSGYYDQGGILRHILDEVASNKDSDEEIQDTYTDIVLEHPFVVYVGRYDTAEKIKCQAKTRVQEYDSNEYSIPYIDVRAQGRNNKKTAKQALNRLNEEFNTLPVEQIEGERELVYRIDPENAEL